MLSGNWDERPSWNDVVSFTQIKQFIKTNDTLSTLHYINFTLKVKRNLKVNIEFQLIICTHKCLGVKYIDV